MKFLIKKSTFEGDRVSYSAVITSRDQEGNKIATAYLPVSFKKDNMPEDKYVSFLVEAENFFLSAYAVEGYDGKKIGKPKIVICDYTITNDYTDSNKEQAELKPVDEEQLPF